MLKTDLLVLGLEIHIQPKTSRKMFCRCGADIWQAEANTHTCPTCLGLPGALPVPNLEAVQKTQLLGLALGCELNKSSRFDRKHYFYPDLPKGYQISQYQQPLCVGGGLALDSGTVAELERIHLEEDTAKSFHEGNKTLIDFNKSGMPLIEVVTKPIFNTVGEAVEFCKKIQLITRAIGISAADMEKGQMRLEANISLRTSEMEERGELPKYKVEIKNINSFRFLEKAVKSEIERQKQLFESGQAPVQENRGFNEASGKTVSQREKEEAKDYRYFPEPDIPVMEFDDTHIENLRRSLPELPGEIVKRLTENHGLSQRVAQTLVTSFADKLVAFEEDVRRGFEPVKVANAILNKKEAATLNGAQAVVGERELEKLVQEVIAQNAKIVADYKKGKANAIQPLIGFVLKKASGKVSAEEARTCILSHLG